MNLIAQEGIKGVVRLWYSFTFKFVIMMKNRLFLLAMMAVFLTGCGNKTTNQSLTYEDSVAINDSLEATADQLMEEIEVAASDVAMKQPTNWMMASMVAIVLAAAPATINAQDGTQQRSDNAQTAKQNVAGKLDKVQGKHDKAAAYDSTVANNRRKGSQSSKDQSSKDQSSKDQAGKAKALKGDNAEKADKSKGHAYGRDKDGLQGREFGQSRAAQARLQGAKADTLKTRTDMAIEKVSVAREKVNQAKANLEKTRKAGKLTEAQYAEKVKKVEAAQQAIDKLEAKTKKAKVLLEGSPSQKEITIEAPTVEAPTVETPAVEVPTVETSTVETPYYREQDE
jgi:hypothetical protein